MRKNNTSKFVGLLIIISFSVVLFAGGKTFAESLVILNTNDVHGRCEPIDYKNRKNVGGFAARAEVIKNIKAKNPNVLVLDAGDIAQGTIFYKFFSGIPDMKLMAEAGYDAVELGNHEFDKGHKSLEKIVKAAKCHEECPVKCTVKNSLMRQPKMHVLCANIKFNNNKSLQKHVKPYLIKEYNGFKVGIIGVITHELKALVKDSSGFEVLDPAQTAEKIVKEISPQVDLIIVLSHVGIQDDMQIAAKVPEINMIIGGHSHTLLEHPKKVIGIDSNPVYIVHSGEFGVYMGYSEVEFRDKKIDSLKYRLIKIDGSRQDEHFAKKIEKLSNKIESKKNIKIGSTLNTLEFSSKAVKTGLTNTGTLITKAVKSKVPYVDFVLQNSGGIRGNKNLPMGILTKGDIYELYPFENNITTARIKGSEVKSVLETSSRFLPEQSDSFMQSLGLEYKVNLKNSPQVISDDALTILCEGNRVSDIKINGKPLESEKYYKFAVNDFVMNGGNGYTQFKKAVNIKKTGYSVQNAIIEYIKKNSPVSVKVEDKIILF